MKDNSWKCEQKKFSVGKHSTKTYIVFKGVGYGNEISNLSQKVIN